MTTTDAIATEQAVAPIFDYCPTWCTNPEHPSTKGSRHGSKWLDEPHFRSVGGTLGVYVSLSRENVHGVTPRRMAEPHVEVAFDPHDVKVVKADSRNDLDTAQLTAPAARSLAAALLRAADLLETPRYL